jgi:glycosyltransferase involved in cell wall biosynthesis
MRSVAQDRRTKALGIVIPVHNEEERLESALGSIFDAVRVLRPKMKWAVAIVLDDCTDASNEIAQAWMRNPRVILVRCSVGNVGNARRAGCTALLRQWVDIDPAHVWLSTTDADSTVPEEWLAAQIHAHEGGADVWSGRVSVMDWGSHSSDTSTKWEREYNNETAPIHGASLGFNARTYLNAGGFRPIATGEDRALFKAMLDSGARVHLNSTHNVLTSARRSARAPLGFAHALNAIALRSATLIPVS